MGQGMVFARAFFYLLPSIRPLIGLADHCAPNPSLISLSAYNPPSQRQTIARAYPGCFPLALLLMSPYCSLVLTSGRASGRAERTLTTEEPSLRALVTFGASVLLHCRDGAGSKPVARLGRLCRLSLFTYPTDP